MTLAVKSVKENGGQPNWMTWTGRVLSAIPILLFVLFGLIGLSHSPQVIAGMEKFGYPASKVTLVCSLELISALLYAIPQTAVFGAIVMTGYLGGAVATHVRVSDPGYPMALLMGVLVWAGLYLRDARLRQLVPIRKHSISD